MDETNINYMDENQSIWMELITQMNCSTWSKLQKFMVESFDDMDENDPQHGIDHKDETYIYQ